MHKYSLHNICGRVVRNSVFLPHQKDLIHWFKKHCFSTNHSWHQQKIAYDHHIQKVWTDSDSRFSWNFLLFSFKLSTCIPFTFNAFFPNYPFINLDCGLHLALFAEVVRKNRKLGRLRLVKLKGLKLCHFSTHGAEVYIIYFGNDSRNSWRRRQNTVRSIRQVINKWWYCSPANLAACQAKPLSAEHSGLFINGSR